MSAVYRALLRLLPRELRASHGMEMEELFDEEVRAAQPHGFLAVARVWTTAIADVLRRAPHEHWRRARRNRNAEAHAMSSLLPDVRYAFRSFGRQPGATASIVGTLALAVAANTAVFSLVDAVFFRPLPYPNASRLVDLNARAPKWSLEFTGVSYRDYDTWQRTARTFEGMALWEDISVNLADGTNTERADGQVVTHTLASVLGIKPVVGRAFLPEEDTPSGPPVVMIGYEMWRTRFAGMPSAVGKTVRINAAPFTIVGVLPPNVVLTGPSALWLPLRLSTTSDRASNYSYEGVGRLKPGVSIDQARADLLSAHAAIWRERDTSRTVSPLVVPLRDRFVMNYKTIGGALGAGVALVLIIACANVAGAMLARSVFRRREMSIRVALGASAKRLTRQLLTEALVLSAIAGVIGTLIGRAGVGLLVVGVEQAPPWLHLSIDARAIAFAVLIVVGTALTFGLVPARQLLRADVAAALVGGGTRMAGSRQERRILNALVVVEIALAAVLLASGGLLLRAYGNLRDVDPGFRPEGTASFVVTLPGATYTNGLAQRRFYETLIARIKALPGVTDAGAVTCPPFTCHWPALYDAEGGSSRAADGTDPIVLSRIATGGYLRAMGIRLIHGRFYSDVEGSPRGPRPVVINDLLAKHLWPGVANPVGKRFNFRGDTSGKWLTVVGVVKDVRHYGLVRPMGPGVYLPLTLSDSTSGFARYTVVAHTEGEAAALFPALRATLRALDPELPMYSARTMRAAVNQSIASRRAVALWLGAFAAIALTLAIGGIYAVLSYVVGRRRHEIGIRMALGAQRAQVLSHVVWHGLRLVLVGLVVGVPVSFAASRVLSSLLVGVTTSDPATYLGVVLALVLTGSIAAWIPARRAAGIDPKIALGEGS